MSSMTSAAARTSMPLALKQTDVTMCGQLLILAAAIVSRPSLRLRLSVRKMTVVFAPRLKLVIDAQWVLGVALIRASSGQSPQLSRIEQILFLLGQVWVVGPHMHHVVCEFFELVQDSGLE